MGEKRKSGTKLHDNDPVTSGTKAHWSVSGCGLAEIACDTLTRKADADDIIFHTTSHWESIRAALQALSRFGYVHYVFW